jgi:hypothetical protein
MVEILVISNHEKRLVANCYQPFLFATFIIFFQKNEGERVGSVTVFGFACQVIRIGGFLVV